MILLLVRLWLKHQKWAMGDDTVVNEPNNFISDLKKCDIWYEKYDKRTYQYKQFT